LDAILFAAGLGTRLGEITREIPKALVPVGGVPILELVARRLIAAGVDRLVVNTHHMADQIERFVQERDGFGVEVVFSHEPGRPLETGGGLANAARMLRRDTPFFLHNVDVLSRIPLEGLYSRHVDRGPLVTLAVMRRESSRRLLFDEQGLLGRVDEGRNLSLLVREPVGPVEERAFTGIHVVSPGLLDRIEERGVFSIFDPYLRLAGAGERIEPFHADGFPWIDIGRPVHLEEAQGWAERTLP